MMNELAPQTKDGSYARPTYKFKGAHRQPGVPGVAHACCIREPALHQLCFVWGITSAHHVLLSHGDKPVVLGLGRVGTLPPLPRQRLPLVPPVGSCYRVTVQSAACCLG